MTSAEWRAAYPLHSYPNPKAGTWEKQLMVPLSELYLGEPLSAHWAPPDDDPTKEGSPVQLAKSVQTSTTFGGSMNHAGFQMALKLRAGVQFGDATAVADATRRLLDFYTQQLGTTGYMRWANRDETLSAYINYHAAIAAFVLYWATDGTLKQHAERFLWQTSALTELMSWRGVSYWPGKRSPDSQTMSDHRDAMRDLLVTGKTSRSSGFFRNKNIGGVVSALGPWLIQDLLLLGRLTARRPVFPADLPKVAGDYHVLRTDQGLSVWCDKFEQASAGDMTWYAAKIVGTGPVAVQGVLNGPAVRPKVFDTSIPGTVVSHWRGDLTGWRRV